MNLMRMNLTDELNFARIIMNRSNSDPILYITLFFRMMLHSNSSMGIWKSPLDAGILYSISWKSKCLGGHCWRWDPRDFPTSLQNWKYSLCHRYQNTVFGSFSGFYWRESNQQDYANRTITRAEIVLVLRQANSFIQLAQ